VNVADGQRQAAIKKPKVLSNLTSCAQRSTTGAHPEAEGRAQAIASVYAAIKLQQPDNAGGDLAARTCRVR